MGGRGPGLFDEAVKEDDGVVTDEEERPGDPGGRPGADLPEALSQGVHQRKAERPAVLNCEDVGPDLLSFVWRQAFQPFTHRFVAGGGAEEDDRKRAGSWLR